MFQQLAQAGLKLLNSRDPPPWPPKSARTTGMSHCAWPTAKCFWNLWVVGLTYFKNEATDPGGVTVLKNGVSGACFFRLSDVSGASSFWWVGGLPVRN